MKAIIWTAYGSPDVLQLQEIAKPVPKDNEVLIKVYAATVTAGDCEARNLRFPFWIGIPMRLFVGLQKPTRVITLGQELAGEVEAVGKAVTAFKAGDLVFGTADFGTGAYLEYVCLPAEPSEGALAIKPANMTYEEAAAVPTGGLEALHFVRRVHIQPGQKVLINGAGGSIGTAAVQFAKHYGAEVTAVDSTAKLDMLRSLGADSVIDYTQDDFAKDGEMYDVIFDVAGKHSFSRSIKALKSGGCYFSPNPRLSLLIRSMFISNKNVIFGVAKRKTEDLLFLRELIEAGKLRSVIDRTYPLEQTAEAHRYVETGQKKGNVVIVIRR
jgi:NADPH:quinone reductase-like Zn-dependent oxidoreductase